MKKNKCYRCCCCGGLYTYFCAATRCGDLLVAEKWVTPILDEVIRVDVVVVDVVVVESVEGWDEIVPTGT